MASTSHAENEFPIISVPVDGRRVGVWRFGTPGGRPVVWNHGGLSCGLDGYVADTEARLCGVEIIAIDRPGIGRSEYWNMSSVPQWPRTVKQVADYLGLDDFAVSGWSGGGPYALACAAAMPQRVSAVAVIESIPEILRMRDVFQLTIWEDELMIPLAHWAPRLAASMFRLSRHVPDRLIGLEFLNAGGHRDRVAAQPLLTLFVKVFREATSGGVSGLVDEYRRYFGPWGFDLGNVQQPVTIWQGGEDIVLPTQCARQLDDQLPNSTLKVVPQTGHLLPLVVVDQILTDLAPP